MFIPDVKSFASLQCDIETHLFDVLVVGGGGAGLRSTLSLASSGVNVACISKLFPTRSNTVSAQGGIAATLGNRGEDKWEWHFYDTVKGSDWLCDQDAVEIMCKRAKEVVVELEHFGVPFSRDENGKIYQRAFGGMTVENGASVAYRTCASGDKTGHAILHTLYQQCLKHKAKFFVEYFVIDLLLNSNGEVCGLFAWSLNDGKLHLFFSKYIILATGGYARMFHACTAALTCTGDGGAMVLRAGLPLKDVEFTQFHPTGLYGSNRLISEAVRSEGGYLVNVHGERFMERYVPKSKDLASRDVISRAIMKEIREGKGCGQYKDHVHLLANHLDNDTIATKLKGVSEIANIFANVDMNIDAIPVIPTAHYSMGGIPTNIHCEVLDKNDIVVQGLMAVGECASVSVHGANRLGSNSLLELIVFGKIAAETVLEKLQNRSFSNPDIENVSRIVNRFNNIRFASGSHKIADLYHSMRMCMQSNCAISLNATGLKSARDQMKSLVHSNIEYAICDRGLIWNSELLDILEFENLLAHAVLTTDCALLREESRGSHFREDFPLRNDEKYMKHSIATLNFKTGEVSVSYSPVRMNTSNDISPMIPQERHY